MMRRLVVGMAALCLVVVASGNAGAQSLGTFMWQQAPYCNLITVNIVQSGANFTVDGTDNQCGAATAAAVVGTAFFNANGTIGLGLSVVTTPGGLPLHIDATIALPSASGTWRDSTGASGNWVLSFGPPAPFNPRPAPQPTFAGGVSMGGGAITNVATPAAATDAATKGYVDTVTTALTNTVRTAFVGDKVWKGGAYADGNRLYSGPYTVTRTNPGDYTFAFNVSALNVPFVGQFPVVVATPGHTPAAAVSAVVETVTTNSIGAQLTALNVRVRTLDAAGAAIDSNVMVMATMPDADGASGVPPLDPAMARRGARCTTTGAVTECVSVPQ